MSKLELEFEFYAATQGIGHVIAGIRHTVFVEAGSIPFIKEFLFLAGDWFALNIGVVLSREEDRCHKEGPDV